MQKHKIDLQWSSSRNILDSCSSSSSSSISGDEEEPQETIDHKLIKLNEEVNELFLNSSLQRFLEKEKETPHMFENDDETKPYRYVGSQCLLTQSLEHSISAGCRVFVCIYQVNMESHTPFLQFLLHKPISNRMFEDEKPLRFIEFESREGECVENLCNHIIKMIKDSFYLSQTEKEVNPNRGYFVPFEENNELYMFFDFSESPIRTHLLAEHNDLWLCLVDEILENKPCVSSPIHPDVREFFKTNPAFHQLCDPANKELLESPMVGYVSSDRVHAEFVATFGAPVTEDHKYMFDVSLPQETSGGSIVRFALFRTGQSLNCGHNIFVEEYEDQVPLTFHYIVT